MDFGLFRIVSRRTWDQLENHLFSVCELASFVLEAEEHLSDPTITDRKRDEVLAEKRELSSQLDALLDDVWQAHFADDRR